MECDLSESVGPQGLAVVDRAEVTGLVRAVSNRENTGVESQMGKTLDGMLLRRGVVTVPAFADTASPYVMLVRASVPQPRGSGIGLDLLRLKRATAWFACFARCRATFASPNPGLAPLLKKAPQLRGLL